METSVKNRRPSPTPLKEGRSFTVTVPPEVFEALFSIANDERRSVTRQAGLFIEQGLLGYAK